MNDKYSDPENFEDIITQMKACPTLGDVVAIVDKLYPKWIKGIMPDYSPDYPSLKKNWVTICNANNVTPKQIVLVDGIYFDDNHMVLKTFSEILTLSGFCVRTKNDLFPCNNCGKALPQSHLYDLIKEKVADEGDVDKIPAVWSVLCEDC